MKNTFIQLLALALLVLIACQGQAQKPAHAPWDALLKKHVNASTGMVDYKGFQKSRNALDAYIKTLTAHFPGQDWSEKEQMAYWINLYNAATVRLILDHYPVKSIMDIHNGKPWDQKILKIGTMDLSLNDIEHEILRKKFHEPRVHFALNCASWSCPVLAPSAYTADKLDQQLEAAAKQFVNDSHRNQIDEKQAKVSQIFNWYGEDFKQVGLRNFLNKYSKYKISDKVEIQFLDYNWSLNEQ